MNDDLKWKQNTVQRVKVKSKCPLCKCLHTDVQQKNVLFSIKPHYVCTNIGVWLNWTFGQSLHMLRKNLYYKCFLIHFSGGSNVQILKNEDFLVAAMAHPVFRQCFIKSENQNWPRWRLHWNSSQNQSKSARKWMSNNLDQY